MTAVPMRFGMRGRPAKLSCYPTWTDVNGFVNISRMEWEIAYHSDDVQQAILEFPPGLQARYIHLTERMPTFGPDLGMPHTRAMGKGLFELRLKSREGI